MFSAASSFATTTSPSAVGRTPSRQFAEEDHAPPEVVAVQVAVAASVCATRRPSSSVCVGTPFRVRASKRRFSWPGSVTDAPSGTMKSSVAPSGSVGSVASTSACPSASRSEADSFTVRLAGMVHPAATSSTASFARATGTPGSPANAVPAVPATWSFQVCPASNVPPKTRGAVSAFSRRVAPRSLASRIFWCELRVKVPPPPFANVSVSASVAFVVVSMRSVAAALSPT